MNVLLADAEEARAKRIEEALAGNGWSVARASHGPGALELALVQAPDVLVCALELPLIDGGRLADILRANPNTRELGVVYLAEDELDAPISLDRRDRIVVAPWETAAILAHVEASHAGPAGGEGVGSPLPEPTPEGDTPAERPALADGAPAGDQARPIPERAPDGRAAPGDTPATSSKAEAETALPLPDLLETLQKERRSGSVRFSPRSGPVGGAVRVIGGRVVEAAVETGEGGRVRGEKALFRLLDAAEGRFDFVAEEPDDAEEDTEPHIRRPLATLLVEAARQRDEWQRHSALLPQAHAFLRLVLPRRQVPTAQHPLTAAVLDALETHSRVGEVVDRCPYPDYQVLRVLHELMLSGAARVEPGTDPAQGDDPGGSQWLDEHAVRRVREWMVAQRAGLGAGVKLLVVPGSADAFDGLDRALRITPGYAPASDRPAGPSPLGPVGRLPLAQGLGLWLVAAPPDPAYAPVWPVATDGILGTLVVLRTPVAQGLEACAELLHQIDDRVPGRPRVYLVVGPSEGALEPLEPGREVFALEHPQVAAPAADDTEVGSDPNAPPAGLREAIKGLLP